MNITMFLTEYFPPKKMNANHNRIYYLAKGLQRKNNVIIICPNNKFKYDRYDMDGIKIFKFPFLPIRLLGKTMMILNAKKYIKIILMHEKIKQDILWYNSARAFNVSKNFNCTKIYDIMGIDSNELLSEDNIYNKVKSFFYKIFENITYKNSDVIITINNAHKNMLSNKFSGKIYILRDAVLKKTGINKKLYSKIKNEYKNNFVVFFVGSFGRRRFEKIIDSFKPLSDAIKKLKFVVAGDGLFLEDYKKRIKELNIERNFEFIGHVKGKELNSYIKMSDVCISDVFLDGFPYKIFEYMAMKKAMLIEETVGVKEILKDNYNGLLYKNAKDFKKKILILANNKKLRDTLGEQAKKDSKKYTWDFRQKEFEEILDKIKNEKKQE